MENSYHGFSLQFITIYFGVLLRILRDFSLDFVDSKQRPPPKKMLETLIFWGGGTRKIGSIYYRYYGILRISQKLLLWNITEHFYP